MLKAFIISIKYLLCFTALLLFSTCSEPTKKNKETKNLLKDKPVTLTYVDSIVTGKPMPLSFEIDTVHPQEITNADEIEIGTLVKNKRPMPEYSYRDMPAADTVFDVEPEVVSAKPYISNINHPSPMKAGGWRSTGSANENIQCLGVEEGLPSTIVYDIKEDKDGFMWIAHPAGLTKYDGSFFYNYTKKCGLVTNKITQILIDKKNTLWLATQEGLMHYDGKKIETYLIESGLKSNYISTMMFDLNDVLWIACSNGSVCRFENNKFYHYTNKLGLKTNTGYCALAHDNLNRIVVGYYGAQASFIDEKNKQILNYPEVERSNDYIGSNIITATCYDRNGFMWLATYNSHIVRFLPNTKTRLVKPTGDFGFAYYTAITEDQNGHFWIGSSDGGVIYMNNDKEYTTYSTINGLSSNMISCIYEDKAHNIWIGTGSGGLNKIAPASFKTMSSKDGFTDKGIVAIYQNNNKEMIFGTWASGYFLAKGATFTCAKSIYGAIVLSFIEDENKNMLISTHQFGIRRLAPNFKDSLGYSTIQQLTDNEHFHASTAYEMLKDSKGNIWMADYYSGIWMLNGNIVHHYSDKTGLSTSHCTNLCLDKEDNIWVNSVDCGVSFISRNTITHFTKKNGLPSNNVKVIYCDSQNTIWFGTNEGLTYYKNKKFTTITTKDNLSSDNISSIIEDHKNRMWIGTSKGLNVLLSDTNNLCGYRMLGMHKHDMLQTLAFSTNSSFIDNEKNIWLGSSKGVVKINLNEFDQETEIPKVHITQIDLMEEFVDYAALEDSNAKSKEFLLPNSGAKLSTINIGVLKPYFNYPETLTLPYNINSVTFNYSAMNGIQSSSMRYRYKLTGRDKKYNIETKNSEVKFDNLSYGRYTFEVQARVQNGVWGPTAKYDFRITPPFWHTWWFRILASAIALFLIAITFRIRNRQLIKRQHALEETVTERTKEIHDQKIVLEEKQKEIVDSINYAKRIQQSQLPTTKYIERNIKRLNKN
jgi:ligand-binding sensor domain-containing protein